MFDLPTHTKKERKAATHFRNFLLDEGFEHSQLSVYARFVNGKGRCAPESIVSAARCQTLAMFKYLIL